MKLVYNWLKDFVDVTASPQDLASRLALSGTNIGTLENTAHGAIIDTEISSNRPDCLAHYGLAREVAAIYKLPLKPILPKLKESAAKVSDALRVEIRSPELCARYTARVIRGVKIQPSPQWLKDRLEAAGIASINSVVDATNYVMLELGNPLHAFDYDKIRDHSIVVRRANPGEKMRTLDGMERTLDQDMCMVCDGKDGSRAIGSGVMGGAETEISFSTRNVLIECAWFDPVSIRRAARSLKLHTEASTRYGRGVDPEMAETASRRCAELILQIAGGELLSGIVDVYPGKRVPKKIRVTRAEILRVMGADVPDKEIEASLGALGFVPVRVDENRGAQGSLLAAWECTQPSWRADVEREIDLIEEIARIYGFDKFPPRLPASRQGASRLPYYAAEAAVRERLVGLGYREILTIPHVAEARDALFRPANAHVVELANPLSEEANVLRSTGAVTMVAALEWNLNHGQRNLRLFEIAHHYRWENNKPVETRILCIGAAGEATQKNIYEPAREYVFADLKGDIDSVANLAGGFQWADGGPDWLNASQRGQMFLGKEALGAAGQLARNVAEHLKFRQNVFLAELKLGPVYCAFYGTKNARRYEPLPKFPAVDRDFSLLLSEGTRFAEVQRVIRELGIGEIASIQASDLFRGKNIPAGKFSMLVQVIFQSWTGTLTEAQINEYSRKIVAAVSKELGAELRAI
jgi:phenylalanyl-tRNA synthetase beta chain